MTQFDTLMTEIRGLRDQITAAEQRLHQRISNHTHDCDEDRDGLREKVHEMAVEQAKVSTRMKIWAGGIAALAAAAIAAAKDLLVR